MVIATIYYDSRCNMPICYNSYYPLSTTITNAILWEALEWEDDAFKQSLESIVCIFSFFDIYSLHYNVVVIIC